MKRRLEDYEWVLTWVLVGFLFFSVLLAIANFRVFFVLMGIFALYLTLYPPIKYRDPSIMPAFELVALLSTPFIVFVTMALMPLTNIFTGVRVAEMLAIFVISLVMMIHLQRYHGLVLDRILLIFFMIAFTSTLGMFHTLGLYFNDQLFGTSFVTSNHVLMTDMTIATLGGVILSFILLAYMRRRSLFHMTVPDYQRRNGQ